MLVRDGPGTAVVIVSITAFEVIPGLAASGLNTVTWSAAGKLTSEAKIVAVTWSGLMNTVGRLLPLI
jgi:hypothetical protein